MIGAQHATGYATDERPWFAIREGGRTVGAGIVVTSRNNRRRHLQSISNAKGNPRAALLHSLATGPDAKIIRIASKPVASVSAATRIDRI
jgi:hypothetical protein